MGSLSLLNETDFSFLLFLSLLFFFSPSLQGEENPPPPPPIGNPFLRDYLSLAGVVRPSNVPDNTLAILRIDPELWSFRVFFNKEPKTIKEWQQLTGAPVLCNGGYYQENLTRPGESWSMAHPSDRSEIDP